MELNDALGFGCAPITLVVFAMVGAVHVGLCSDVASHRGLSVAVKVAPIGFVQIDLASSGVLWHLDCDSRLSKFCYIFVVEALVIGQLLWSGAVVFG